VIGVPMKKSLLSLAAALLVFGASCLHPARAQNGQPYPRNGQSYPQNAQPYPPNDQGYPQQYPGGSDQQDPNMPPPPQDQGSSAQQNPNVPPPPQGEAAPSQQPGQAEQGVGRLSFVHGDVSQQRGDNGQWVASTLNTPVAPGDRVSTGQDARAELQLDYANILRMSNNVTANIVALTRTNIQIQLGQGLTTFSVLKGSEAQSEIDTPNAAIRPLGEGDFRILVNSNAETQVIVRNGSVEISTPQGTTRVDKGQIITIAGTDNPQYKTDAAPSRDEWDSWNSDRDKRITTADSWRNTDRYYTGTEDLDQNGTWSEIPDYGPVWSPREDQGWAPYRAGRWVYEPYYGWTWVSYEPWGWAPYHYGRWMVYSGSWVWWPGPVRAYPGYYPMWAPAYVSFFGFGGGGWGLSIGIGFGGGWGRVGWLPVGPGDWYHPWYGGWGARYSAIGVAGYGGFHEGFSPLGVGRGERFSNVDAALRNDRVRGGFSSMAGNEFGRGAVSMHQEGVSEASLRQSSAMTGRMPVNPSRESFSPSNRAVNPSTIRGGSVGSQRFYSTNRAGSPAAGGARGDAGFGGNRSGSFERPSSNGVPPNRGSAGGETQQGWHTFNSGQSGAVTRSEQGGSGRAAESPSRISNSSSPNTASRGGYAASSNSYNRPPLNMRQPIVTPRGGDNESRAGGNPAYSAQRGNSAAGNTGRGNSAPRGGSPNGNARGGGGSRGGGHSR
jgi:FecR protein